MRQPQYGSYVLHSHAPRLLTSWHVLSRPCSRPGECRDGADDDQPCSGSSQAVRELPESLSGIYRNACPRITEIRVREFAKPANERRMWLLMYYSKPLWHLSEHQKIPVCLKPVR